MARRIESWAVRDRTSTSEYKMTCARRPSDCTSNVRCLAKRRLQNSYRVRCETYKSCDNTSRSVCIQSARSEIPPRWNDRRLAMFHCGDSFSLHRSTSGGFRRLKTHQTWPPYRLPTISDYFRSSQIISDYATKRSRLSDKVRPKSMRSKLDQICPDRR